MRSNQTRPIAILLGVLAVLLIAMPGCQSGMFKRPDLSKVKAPDLSGLAFWKKDKNMVPPPPAHHFEPAPASGEVANSQKSDVQKQFEQLVATARKSKEASQAAAESPGQAFDPDKLAAEKELPDLQSSVAKAQKEFNDAIASTKNDINNSVKSSANSISSQTDKLKNDFRLPANVASSLAAESKQQLANASNDFHAQAAKINRSLYDSAGELTTGLNKQVENTLKPNLNGVANATNQAIHNSVSTAQAAMEQVKQPVVSELEQAQAQVELARQQIEELKRQMAEVQQQTADRTADAVQSIAKTASEAVAKPLDHVARLNFPIPVTSAKTQNSFPAQASSAASENFSPMQLTPNELNFNGGGVSTGNSLRDSSDFSPLQESGSRPSQPQPVPQPSQSYPSTPHGSYSGSFSGISRDSNVKPAGLLSPNTNEFADFHGSSGGQVVQASSPSPKLLATPKPASPAAHVADVDIPEAVLRGSGSFAPGTVNRLTPIK